MPRLLKTNEVQLHMPRTGGTSLAKQIGVKKLVGTIHDGPEQIPDGWRELKTVATLRGPVDWRLSMAFYLKQIGYHKHADNFIRCEPKDLWVRPDLDPSFGLWETSESFQSFCFTGAAVYQSWYELYIDYFLEAADRIIPVQKLKVHAHKGKYKS